MEQEEVGAHGTVQDYVESQIITACMYVLSLEGRRATVRREGMRDGWCSFWGVGELACRAMLPASWSVRFVFARSS